MDGPIAIVTINRPEVLNALNKVTVQELEAVIAELENKVAEVGAVVITGSGEKSFVAGADILEMADMTAQQARDWGRSTQKILMRLEY
jgi:enoyl-CoA hydratase